MVYAGLFAAVTAALGLLIIPIQPVPITGQSMGPMLAGSILGSRVGGLSLLIFDLLVAAGVPVLAGGRGGLGIILGPTGGYIISWPIAAYVIGKIVEQKREKSLLFYFIANVLGGIVIVYFIGVLWLSFQQGLDFKTALFEGALIFIPGDMVKAAAASITARSLSKVISVKD
ncbi:MAG TPA: biotin transporter BioY [Peptococcaceae bacterium]|nr:biotin transporter BioY [Peptococcaceae bacterium]